MTSHTRAEVEALIERTEAYAGLLRVYGDVRESPTLSELWAGCKDAAPVLAAAHATLRALLDEREHSRTALAAWHTIFGTTQLTHAAARLEKTEADLARIARGIEDMQHELREARELRQARELLLDIHDEPSACVTIELVDRIHAFLARKQEPHT